MPTFSGALVLIEAPNPPHWVSPEQRGGVVQLSWEVSVLPRKAVKAFHCVPLLVLVCVLPGLSQRAQKDAGSLPKYDLQTETKTTGVIDEVNLLPVGARKDFTELIIRSGEDKVHIYVCPRPFQEEMGISFNKGDQVAITGSKVKQNEADVILARQLVRGTDTLLFRDDKGSPVWDPRTGK
jgi:hypothetical protein